MDDEQLRALNALHINATPTAEDVWLPFSVHVDELNARVYRAIAKGVQELQNSHAGNPRGIAITGSKGVGKTHAIHWARDHVQGKDGYFFLPQPGKDESFWPSILRSIVDGLKNNVRRGEADGQSQLGQLLAKLMDKAEVSEPTRQQIRGVVRPLTKEALAEFTDRLATKDNASDVTSRCAARALAMVRSGNSVAADIGEWYLLADEEIANVDGSGWGLPHKAPSAERLAIALCRLFSLTAPIVFAFDQIDSTIAQSKSSSSQAGVMSDGASEFLANLGNGMMDLREKLPRTLTIVASQSHTWEELRNQSLNSVADRFHPELHLDSVGSPETARALITAIFAQTYNLHGFSPPHGCWPIPWDAFIDVQDYRPRNLIMWAEQYVNSCLDAGELVESVQSSTSESVSAPGSDLQSASLTPFDQEFADLTTRADVAMAQSETEEDRAIPPLLGAALKCWFLERQVDQSAYRIEQNSVERAPIHTRAIVEFDGDSDDQIELNFRATARQSAQGINSRIDKAVAASKLSEDVPHIKLYLLESVQWPIRFPSTNSRIDKVIAQGGKVLPMSDGDLRTFDALWHMTQGGFSKDFVTWLRARCPATNTTLLGEVEQDLKSKVDDSSDVQPPLAGDAPPVDDTWLTTAQPALPFVTPHEPESKLDSIDPSPIAVEWRAPDPAVPQVRLGNRDDGAAVNVTLEALRKHTAIFAGSGSGKTVLIRRIIEECALQGVSAIVLDPNNDLARLGDPWPSPPAGWRESDIRQSAEYLANTEVVVWTPRRETGRPLSLQPLPDLASVADDRDELGAALDNAIATIAPRVRADGATAKADRSRAVLRQTLTHLARRGGRGMAELVQLLAELPEDVTSLAKADMIASDLAQNLSAAMINDPLFGGEGVALDPGALLTPTHGKRARVSVISFVGLGDIGQQRSFVNQLAMALFAWVKKHPAGDRPLGGLFVMDEAQNFAPSGEITACTESTLALASQARKYGLGLVFATQSPKGIHNRISGNAANQLFGFLNSPAQIETAKKLAREKTSSAVDISRLTAGEFYSVGEGSPFTKIASPMCLSHHPSSPLTAEEVLERARNNG